MCDREIKVAEYLLMVYTDLLRSGCDSELERIYLQSKNWWLCMRNDIDDWVPERRNY